MKNIEAIRKMDAFEKRLADLNSDYKSLKDEIAGESPVKKKKSTSKKK